MTCHEMTERMLEAELDELSGVGQTALARHVRRCIPCRTAARNIVEGTRRLAVDVLRTDAVEVHASPMPRPRRRALLVWSAAAAAVALVLATQVRDDDREIALPPSVAIVIPPAASFDSTILSNARPVARPVRRPISVQRTPALLASAVVATTDLVPHVTVDVPPGRQAVVMRTANPLVTVVWLR